MGFRNQNPKKSLDQKSPPPPTPTPQKQKKSHAEFLSLKNFQKAWNDIRWNIEKQVWLYLFVELCGQDMQSLHESSDCFEYPQNSLIKPSHPNKFLPKFPTLKKSQNWKFQTPKLPSIILVSWNPKYPLGSCLLFKFYVSFLYNSLIFITIT